MKPDLDELLNTIQMLKEKRDSMVEMFDDQIAGLMNRLEGHMKLDGLKKLATDEATAFWKKNTAVTVTNWTGVMQYVKDNDAFDILQRRISPAQLKARLEAGAKIDGVSLEEIETFMVSKKRGEKE